MVQSSLAASQIDGIISGIDQLSGIAYDILGDEEGRPFIPRHALQRHLPRDTIKLLLSSCSHSVATAIHNYYISVFGILIAIGKRELIVHFLPHDRLADEHLPFGHETFPRACSQHFREFNKAQWKYCALRLQPGRLDDKHFENSRIIPIVRRKLLKKGPEATIHQIEIHPEYSFTSAINGSDRPSNVFVLKTCRSGERNIFNNEVHAYEMLRNHEDIAHNLARFHGHWQHNNTYNIMLEWIDGGTLAQILEQEHPTTHEDRLYFWNGLLQVINILCRIHCHADPNDSNGNIKGVHQDLRPENILVSSYDSALSSFVRRFILIDFGMTYFQHTDSELRDRGGTKMFSAPECFRPEQDRFLGRTARNAHPSKDIWSLGCIFSLVLVWSVLGRRKVREYQEKLVHATAEFPQLRNTGYSGCFHDGRRVLQVVQDMHIEVLRTRGHNDQIINDLVGIVEDMLRDAKDRPTAVQLRERCLTATDRAFKLISRDDATPVSKHDAISPSQDDRFYPGPFQTGVAIHSPPQSPAKGTAFQESRGLAIHGFSPPLSPDNIGTTSAEPSYVPDLSSSPTVDYGITQVRGSQNIRAFPATDAPSEISIKKSGKMPVQDVSPMNKRSPSGNIERSRRPSDETSQQRYDSIRSHRTTTSIGYQDPEASEKVDLAQHVRDASLHSNNFSRSTINGLAPVHFCRDGCIFVEDVHDWISRKKRHSGTRQLIPDGALDALQGREQIFLIDNTRSTERFRKEIQQTFESLSYLVKQYDRNGMEVYYTKGGSYGRGRHREDLIATLRKTEFVDTGGMEGALSDILTKCCKTNHLRTVLGREKKWSIYVLTDGNWGGEDNSLCGIDDLIRRTVPKIQFRTRLGIQFIQFGNHPAGSLRLKRLDDLKDHGAVEMDIVDTTPSDGCVKKMLLGSIDTAWDGEPSEASEMPNQHRISRASWQGSSQA